MDPPPEPTKLPCTGWAVNGTSLAGGKVRRGWVFPFPLWLVAMLTKGLQLRPAVSGAPYWDPRSHLMH